MTYEEANKELELAWNGVREEERKGALTFDFPNACPPAMRVEQFDREEVPVLVTKLWSDLPQDLKDRIIDSYIRANA